MGITAGTKFAPDAGACTMQSGCPRSSKLPTFAEAHQMIHHFLVVTCGTASLQQGRHLGAGLQIRCYQQERSKQGETQKKNGRGRRAYKKDKDSGKIHLGNKHRYLAWWLMQLNADHITECLPLLYITTAMMVLHGLVHDFKVLLLHIVFHKWD